jgi:ribosomal protein S28E/S33
MQATELRIGNLFNGMGMIQTVFEILDNTDHGRIIQKGYENLILCKENGNQYKPIEISGISLTEEWLIDFGFKKFKHIKYYPWKTHMQGKLSRVKIRVLDDGRCCAARIGHIQYVHQLQNLYFVFTGEELVLLNHN